MSRHRAMRLCAVALVVPWLVAPATDAPPASTPPMLDILLRAPEGAGDSERVREPLADLATRVPLAPDRDFRVAEIGRDEATSHHVVAIRAAETPHRHDRHDLLVVMIRGHGTWRVGDTTHPVGERSILYVPRGTVHAFTNESAAPAIAYAVYTPAFDGVDRVELATRAAAGGDEGGR